MRFLVAMSLALIACWSSGVQAREPACKPKTFPFMKIAGYPSSPLHHLESPPREADELVKQLDEVEDEFPNAVPFTTWYKTTAGLLVYFQGSDTGGGWTGFSKTSHGWKMIPMSMDCES